MVQSVLKSNATLCTNNICNGHNNDWKSHENDILRK